MRTVEAVIRGIVVDYHGVTSIGRSGVGVSLVPRAPDPETTVPSDGFRSIIRFPDDDRRDRAARAKAEQVESATSHEGPVVSGADRTWLALDGVRTALVSLGRRDFPARLGEQVALLVDDRGDLLAAIALRSGLRWIDPVLSPDIWNWRWRTAFAAAGVTGLLAGGCCSAWSMGLNGILPATLLSVAFLSLPVLGGIAGLLTVFRTQARLDRRISAVRAAIDEVFLAVLEKARQERLAAQPEAWTPTGPFAADGWPQVRWAAAA